MLFCLFIEDVISIEQQIYVFVLRHLHRRQQDCPP